MRLRCEALEARELLSAGLPTLTEVEINDTLNQAQNLGDPTAGGGLKVLGTIGNSPAAAADVDWYQFSLSRATRLDLTAAPQTAGGSFAPLLSLYNSDPFDFGDPYDPVSFGHRLLAQDDGAGHKGTASLDVSLAAGTYYLAVSSSGNRYFDPFIADSGEAGSTGPYQLFFQTTDLGLGSHDGPMLLGSDPGSGTLLNRSPFVIRADLSAALAPESIRLGQDVQLLYSRDGDFVGNAQLVPLARANFSAAADELQLFPAAPLAFGYYELELVGSRTSAAHLTGANGLLLGQSAAHPDGQDFSVPFAVGGVEGRYVGGGVADDTPATAHDLGNLTNTGVQIAGAIGDDPTDRIRFNPSDVDLYHFTLSGSGNFALTAEAFAGRIGAPLDPALSLFEVDPATHRLQLVAENDNSFNPTIVAFNNTAPLFTDPVLFAGLTAGDYYLAVSSSGNMPDPAKGLLPGQGGIFDPNVSHSGRDGRSTGGYILDVGAVSDNVPPQVVAVTADGGQGLGAGLPTPPPTHLAVQFSEPVNLSELAVVAYEQTSQSTVRSVYIEAADGTRYFPRLQSWDSTSATATFLMLDGLANGDYTLHLSGPLGLADFAGNTLVGNDPSGDYVVHFSVVRSPRGTNGNPLLWTDQEPNDTLAQAQDLGVLFPHELHDTVVVARSAGTSDTADYYRFQVLQNRFYFFNLNGTLPDGTRLALFRADGTPVRASVIDGGLTLLSTLGAGTYVIRVGSWTPGQGAATTYQLLLSAGPASEHPPALTSGPAPVLRLHLADVSTPGVPPPTPAPVASASPSAVASVPSGMLWLLGGGPLGGTGGDVGPTPVLDTEFARGPGAPLAAPSVALLAPAESGSGDAGTPASSVFETPVVLADSEPGRVPAGETPPLLIADRGDEPLPSPIPVVETSRTASAIAEPSHPVAVTPAVLPRTTAQAAVVPVSGDHDGWVPVLAAIAAYAAVTHRRRFRTDRPAPGTKVHELGHSRT